MDYAFLPDALDDRVTIDGRTYRVYPSVFRVFSAERALADEALLPADRMRLAVRMLFRFPRPKPTSRALDAAFRLLRDESPYAAAEDGMPVLSLSQDSRLITAAFWQQYGIDLTQEADCIDWRVFRMLLAGIAEDTRLGSLMRLRATPIPRRTVQNSAQVDELLRMKAAYAIRTERKKADFNDGLRQMASILERLCTETDADSRAE